MLKKIIAMFVAIVWLPLLRGMSQEIISLNDMKSRVEASSEPHRAFKGGFFGNSICFKFDKTGKKIIYYNRFGEKPSVGVCGINSGRRALYAFDPQEIASIDDDGKHVYALLASGSVVNLDTKKTVMRIEGIDDLGIKLFVVDRDFLKDTYLVVCQGHLFVKSLGKEIEKESLADYPAYGKLLQDKFYCLQQRAVHVKDLRQEKKHSWKKLFTIARDFGDDYEGDDGVDVFAMNNSITHVAYGVADRLKILEVVPTNEGALTTNILEQYSASEFMRGDYCDADISFLDDKHIAAMTDYHLTILKIGNGIVTRVPVGDISFYPGVKCNKNYMAALVDGEDSSNVNLKIWKIPELTASALQKQLQKKLDVGQLVDVVCKTQH